MKRWGLILFVLVAATAVAAQDVDDSCALGQWHGRAAEIEELLNGAEVLSVEDIGMGVTKPSRVKLQQGDVTIDAAFKPIKMGRQHGFWESYQAEIATYKLDKLLGLEMVPPTVERKVKKKKGSLQLWVHSCKLYRDVMAGTPQTQSWSHQLSRMKMLDILINNDDRNAQNFLVDQDWHIVLIDHSRAFASSKKMLKNEKKLPNQYDRELVEKLKTLDRETLDANFKGTLMGGQIKAILERRDFLLSHVEKLIAEKGEAQVFF